MRNFLLFAIAVVFVSHSMARAQAPGQEESVPRVDFSGVYAPAPFVQRPEIAEPAVYPFTAEAERQYNAYDPLVANPRRDDDCSPETMPGVLWLGAPMEIVHEDDRVVIRFERGNTTRVIPMNGSAPASDQAHTELGYSVGRIEAGVLTIETTHMLSRSIRNNAGHPLSPDARVTERYWREPGEKDLQLELLVDDPVNYTDTFTLGRVWIWAPDEQLRAWECVSLGPRDSEVDIDELARMLEEL